MPKNHRAYVKSLTQDELDDLRSVVSQSVNDRDSEERIGKAIIKSSKNGPVDPSKTMRSMQESDSEYSVAGGMRAEQNMTGRRPTDEEVDVRRETWRKTRKRPVDGQKFSGR